MFCSNCGSQIDDRAVICPRCGVPVRPLVATEPERKEVNTLAIIGFVFSFVFTIVGLVCSIIGYRNAPRYGGSGKGLALAGIILSSISIVLEILFIAYCLMLLFMYGGMLPSGGGVI